MFQNQTPHLKCHETTDANGNKNKAYLNWDWKDSPTFFMVFITRNSAFNSTIRCVCVAVAGQKLIIERQVITLTSQKHKFGPANCCQWDFLKTPLIWFCQSVCMRCWYAPLARPSRLPSPVAGRLPAVAHFKWWADGKPTQLSLVSTFMDKDAVRVLKIASMVQSTQQHIGERRVEFMLCIFFFISLHGWNDKKYFECWLLFVDIITTRKSIVKKTKQNKTKENDLFKQRDYKVMVLAFRPTGGRRPEHSLNKLQYSFTITTAPESLNPKCFI